jgi:phosphohistidine phosphatase
MKTLILIRHAKSDWGFEGLEDIDRPLNERGYRDSEVMRDFLFSKMPNIAQFVSSPAIRAFTTASMFARKYSYDIRKIELLPSIYHAPMQNYLEAIHNLDNEVDAIAMFGHNPGITDIASSISDHEFENVATCGIVALQFDVENWNEIHEQSGELIFYEFASNLM